MQIRLEQIPADRIATTIVNYEEQMRGWLERAACADSRERFLASYSRLSQHVETFKGIPLLPFEEGAADEFERLQKAKVRIGTMNLKIAAITIANNATLLTRNLSDFGKVPGLKVEDWSL